MSADVLAQLDAHYQCMPPVRALQLSVESYDGGRLRLFAPLAANVNDKGCAFGGSLASMMTLACWGRVWLGLHEAGLDCDIFVADSRIRYLAPLYDDLRVEADLAVDASWADFLSAVRQKGRGRVELTSRVDLPAGRAATTFDARFAAFLRPSAT